MALTIGQTTLAAIRSTAIDRADEFTAGGQPASYIPTARWNQYIDASRAELWDIIIQKYDGNYKVAPYYPFVADGVNTLYPLPPDFYKLVGVDVQLNGAAPLNSSNGWFTLHRFNNEDRNRFSYPGVAVFGWWTSLFYNLQGDNLWFIPIPQGGQMFRIIYVPRPPVLNDTGTITLYNVATNAIVTASDSVTINGVQIYANSLTVPWFIVGATDVITAQNLACVISSPAWQPSTQYNIGQTVYVVQSGGILVYCYICVQPGTSSTGTGPALAGNGVIDGTPPAAVTWNFCGQGINRWHTSLGVTGNSKTAIQNAGSIYISANATTGITSSTGTGPSGTGSGIIDGTVTWNYSCPAFTNLFTTSADGATPVVSCALSPVASTNGATITWSSSQSMALDPQPTWTNIVDDPSRWVEYIAVDAAIKALRKQQLDTTELNNDKRALLMRIEEVAAHRDPSEPATVSDIRRSNISWPYAYGGRG